MVKQGRHKEKCWVSSVVPKKMKANTHRHFSQLNIGEKEKMLPFFTTLIHVFLSQING